ncbi:MAG: hypothetical protein R3E87_18090 [Burkholderiaceae bacterium]
MQTTSLPTHIAKACIGAALAVGLIAQPTAESAQTLRFGQAMQTEAVLAGQVTIPLDKQIRWRSAGALRLQTMPAYADASSALAALERGELDLAFIRLADAPQQFPHHWVVAELGRLGDLRVSGQLHQKLVDRGVLCGYGLYQVLAAATLPSREALRADGVVLLMNQERYDALAGNLQDVLRGFQRGWLPDRLGDTVRSWASADAGGAESSRLHAAWIPMESRHPGGRLIDRVIAETAPVAAPID